MLRTQKTELFKEEGGVIQYFSRGFRTGRLEKRGFIGWCKPSIFLFSF